jgi:hypothetical protein
MMHLNLVFNVFKNDCFWDIFLGRASMKVKQKLRLFLPKQTTEIGWMHPKLNLLHYIFSHSE